jgi:transposase
MGRVKARSLRLREAAELLELSYRQAKRIWARYRVGGAKALQHGNCGRVSNRAYAAKFRAAVLQQVQARYEDFGPTLAAEHLASDDGLPVNRETLRRWLQEAGWWQRQRRRKPYRQRREAKAHFGELVQMDGSFHEWLEERGPRGCLMHMVDDATTKALGWFSEEETIWAAAGVLRRWIERYGVPPGLVHGLEERVRAVAECRRAGEWRTGGDAVWADVREAGHPHHRRQFAASERTGGASAWHAPGSAGEETAAGRDRQLRPGQRVSGEARSRRAQPPLRAPGRGPGRLSPAATDGAATGRSVLAGGGTSGERGLGGALGSQSRVREVAMSAFRPIPKERHILRPRGIMASSGTTRLDSRFSCPAVHATFVPLGLSGTSSRGNLAVSCSLVSICVRFGMESGFHALCGGRGSEGSFRFHLPRSSYRVLATVRRHRRLVGRARGKVHWESQIHSRAGQRV